MRPRRSSRPSRASGSGRAGRFAPSRRRRVVAWTAIAATTVLTVAVLGAYFTVRAKLDSIGRIVMADTKHRPPKYDNALNILLLGSDTRSGHNAAIGGKVGCNCSDTIMIAHISPGRGRVTVLSIPRDTMVPLLRLRRGPGDARAAG